MRGKRGDEFDPVVLRWLADISDAINAVGSCKTTYGEFDLGDIPVLLDGDPNTGLAIVGSEFGDRHVPAKWEAEDAQ